MKYWIVINNKQAGPYELEQLRTLPVLPNTPVWHEGLDHWVPAAQVPEIVALFRPTQVSVPDSEKTDESADTEISDNTDFQQNPATESDDTVTVENAAEESTSATSTDYTFTQTQPAFVQQQQQPQQQSQQQQNVNTECPSSYLGWSIASTLLCCTPLGVAAIIYSAKVKTKYNSGDLKGAEKASEIAQWLIMLSITLGLIISPLQGLLQLL